MINYSSHLLLPIFFFFLSLSLFFTECLHRWSSLSLSHTHTHTEMNVSVFTDRWSLKNFYKQTNEQNRTKIINQSIDFFLNINLVMILTSILVYWCMSILLFFSPLIFVCIGCMLIIFNLFFVYFYLSMSIVDHLSISDNQ